MAKEHKLDIFEQLRAIDQNRYDWLSEQSEDAQKEFSPLMTQRWATTMEDGREAEYLLLVINDRVNDYMFDLTKRHPDLVYRLFASCGLGETIRRQWLAGPARKLESNAATKLMVEWYPEANDVEITTLLAQYDRPGFIAFVDGCGTQPADAKEVVKAFDKIFPEKVPARKARGAD